MSSGLQLFIFMGIILKIPIVAAGWLLWRAAHDEPEPVEAAGGEGGGGERTLERRRPQRPPRGPRRGPHSPGSLPIPCPEDEGDLRITRCPARSREYQV